MVHIQSVGNRRGITSHSQEVIALFIPDNKCTDFRRVQHEVRFRSDDEQSRVMAVFADRMQQVIAEPVVTERITESDFKLRPRTVEEVGSVKILLDQ